MTGQGTELGMVRNRLSAEVPVWFKGSDALMASLGVDESHFSGEALLPDSQRAFPSDLWKVQVGLKHMRQYSSGATRMLLFDVESASDKPFQSSRDIDYTVGGFYLKPAKNGRDSWTLGAIYSPLGYPNFPIPLVSYNWNRSKTFRMSLGIPLSMSWQPIDDLSLDVSVNPGGGDAIATYKISDRSGAYGGYQQVSDQYFLSDRLDKKEAFFALEKRWIVGVRRDVGKGVSFNLNAGYAFDRRYGEGDDERDLDDRVDLEPTSFLGAKLIWNF